MAKIKVKIKKELEEVYSDEQRNYMCVMAKRGAKRPKGLSQKEAEEMCTGPMKNEGKMSKDYCEKTPCKDMGFSQRASCAKYKKCPSPKKEGKDPAKGTGKKPKGSGRRLYTDEDPTDTVSVSFKSVSAIKKTLAKPSFKSKSHKRQSQIINLMHQRARAAYKNAKDPKVKARLKKAYEYAEKRKEASKKKTIRLRKNKK
jgi:hypothetical protein